MRLGMIIAMVFVVGCSEPIAPTEPETSSRAPSRPLAAPPAAPWRVVIPAPSGHLESTAYGVTGDGLVVGTASPQSPSSSTGWAALVDPVSTKVSGSIVLEPLPKQVGSGANGVSGSLIAGVSTTSSGETHAVYWVYPDPTPHPVPIERDRPSVATAAGGGVIVGWFTDESGMDRAFFYEAGAAAVGKIPVPAPSRAMGVSEDGTLWAGCYAGAQNVAFVRGRSTVDLVAPRPPNSFYPPSACAFDVDDAGLAVGHYYQADWRDQYFNGAATGTGPSWNSVFPSNRPPLSEALATGLVTVGWLNPVGFPDQWGVAGPGVYAFALKGQTLTILPAIADPSKAQGVSSNGACLIAGQSGRFAVVWGC